MAKATPTAIATLTILAHFIANLNVAASCPGTRKPTQKGTPTAENLGKLAHNKRSQEQLRQTPNHSEDIVVKVAFSQRACQ
jgi:hypothetical protein